MRLRFRIGRLFELTVSKLSSSPKLPERLHGNRGAYCGEQIDVVRVIGLIHTAAEERGWAIHELTRQAEYSVWVMARKPSESAGPPRRIYISTGIHGDEPAGPLAALQLVHENRWPLNSEITLVPCLNPSGIVGNLRVGPEGIDYNRDYRDPKTSLVRSHLAWLQRQARFDLALLLHEDWEADGFYLYELNPLGKSSVADDVIRAVADLCPILEAKKADDWPASNGVVRPNVDPAKRPDWPEALYLAQKKADLCYTFEAPSDYALPARVAALVMAVNKAIQQIASVSR